MAKLKLEEFEKNNQLLKDKLNKFLINEGFENFSITRLDVSSDCNVVTKEYCEQRGMKRKRIKKGDEWICYCVLK